MTTTESAGKTFFTVKEAAEIMRVDAATLYRAIRDDAFPAVRIRTRYVVPAKAINALVEQATASGHVVDPATIVAERRMARQVRQVAPEWT
jgi:excisionase family DNA binding protein